MSSSFRACPFCAEEIRAAAVVCKHCQRDVTPLTGVLSDESSKTRRGWLRWAFVGVLCVALVATGVRLVEPTFGQSADVVNPVARSSRIAEPPPLTLTVTDSAALEIGPGKHYVATWRVSDQRPCQLTGRVMGLVGGRKDVDILVLTEDGHANWSSGLTTEPIYQSGRVAAQALKVQLPGPGRYAFVLDNSFSVVTAKTVQTQDIRVTCGSW